MLVKIGEYNAKVRMTSFTHHEHYYQLDNVYDKFKNNIDIYNYDTYFLNDEPFINNDCIMCGNVSDKADMLFDPDENIFKICYSYVSTITYWNRGGLQEDLDVTEVIKPLGKVSTYEDYLIDNFENMKI